MQLKDESSQGAHVFILNGLCGGEASMIRSYSKKNVVHKEWILLTVLMFSLFLIHVWNIKDLYLPNILDDEFGYWSNAAYFAGIDWSSAASYISYYSYGYSILLAPLFWIFDDPVIMYRAALVINSLLLSLILLISYSIAKKMFPQINKLYLLIASLCVSLYPSYIVYVNIAWSESLLIFICWMIVWCFIRLNRNASMWMFSLTALLLVYAYSIHQRTLGILVAGVFIVILMKVYRYINWKHFFSFMLTLGIFLIIHIAIKDEVIANVFLNTANTTNNDYSGQVDKIKQLLTLDGIVKAIQVMCGQFFYFGASTYLIAYFGIISILIMLYQLIKNKPFLRDHIKPQNHFINQYFLFFLLLALTFSFLISVIFMSQPNRIDHILYGRYTDMIIGPFILVGIISIFGYFRKLLISSFVAVILLLITGYVSKIGVESLSDASFNGITTVGIRHYYKLGSFNFHFAIAMAIGIGLLIVFSSIFKKIKLIPFASLAILGLLFLFTGKRMVIGDLIPSHKSNYQSHSIVNIISNSPVPVYFLIESNFNIDRTKDFFQYLLLDRKLICVTEKELARIEGHKFVITGNPNPLTFSLHDEYALVHATASNYLWESKELMVSKKKEFTLPFSMFYTINGLINVDGEIITTIQSDGSANYLIYGPYITLEKGKYNITAQFELLNANQDEVGYFEAVSGGTILSRESIMQDQIDKNNIINSDIQVDLDKTYNNVEFRIFTHKGTYMRVKSINLRLN